MVLFLDRRSSFSEVVVDTHCPARPVAMIVHCTWFWLDEVLHSQVCQYNRSVQIMLASRTKHFLVCTLVWILRVVHQYVVVFHLEKSVLCSHTVAEEALLLFCLRDSECVHTSAVGSSFLDKLVRMISHTNSCWLVLRSNMHSNTDFRR
jgi:hypothetical protein